MQTCVGILEQMNQDGLVLLDRPDPLLGREVFVAAKDLNGAPFGMKVVCALLHTITEPVNKPARGKIIEVLGDPERPDVAVLAIIRQYGLPDHFPELVLEESESFGVNPDPAVIIREINRGRLDLRDQRTMTIDGADAKDLDDAVSIASLSNGRFRLGVHIADVSFYVSERSKLDVEARRRGTSVYLADRVIPMLPPRLSNGICSLNPDQDRLALSVILNIGPDGETEDGEIVETVIRSKARTTYEEVREALETRVIPPGRSPEFLTDLQQMRQLAECLEQRRIRRGSLEFDFPETVVKLGPDGRPLDIRPYPASFANGMIEAFMIAANEFVARRFYFLQAPFLYRVHELPDPEKLRRFTFMASLFGIRIRLRGTPSPAALARVLEQAKHEPCGLTLAQLLLRSLAKARYSAANLGHFGLASEYYCHFTSPIRRYPDLYIHRIIKAYLHGRVRHKTWQMEIDEIASRCSDQERLAMQAERDSVNQKAAEYLSERLGEEYGGVISGFSPAGIYVQLPSTIEGMVPFRSMQGFLVYDEDRMQAVNSSSGRVYRLGEAVSVQVARVDVIRRRIDFELLAPQGRPENRGRTGENVRTKKKTAPGRQRSKRRRPT